jgi:hypothetical protein
MTTTGVGAMSSELYCETSEKKSSRERRSRSSTHRRQVMSSGSKERKISIAR